MFTFFTADFNSAYSIALAIMLGLAMLEGVAMLIGLSLLSALDDLIPADLSVDSDAQITTPGLTSVLGWLGLNQLPLLIWLVLFLTSFGLTGISVNYISFSALDMLFPSSILFGFSLIFAVICSKFLGRRLAKIFPKNESTAISSLDMQGLEARITVGVAKLNSSAEATCVDNYGQRHYVMVQPIEENQEFTAGTNVVLIEKQTNYWLVAKLN